MENKNVLVKGMISVIIPVYNAERYLRQCLESIINQNYKNIEAILTDDGSTDDSGRMCDEYAFKDKRVTVIHTDNKGPAAARNKGIENSKGEFIFFIDADDFIDSDALSLLIESYNKHKADIIIGDFKKIKNGIIEKKENISLLSDKLLTNQDIIDYSRLYLKKPNRHLLFAFSWGRLFKASIIKDKNISFNPNLHTFEDVAFNFDYLKYINKLIFLKMTAYNHLIHNNYMSATMSIGGNPNKLFGHKQAITHIGNFLKNRSGLTNGEIKKETGHAYVFLTIIQLVRICGQIDNSNKKEISQVIQEQVNDPNLRRNLRFYSPEKGESKILPILMKLKFVWLIILVCKYKANKRYKKA
ncbi:glycosyltransferase [Patescibacteria group bacterium]|nr:glycosyltransferase [Patescibacteria group bacterium]